MAGFQQDPGLSIGYHKIRGLGAPLRMMAYFKNQSYIDVAYGEDAAEQWFGGRKPEIAAVNACANLPYVLDGSATITQSISCMLYLGLKYGIDSTPSANLLFFTRNHTVLDQTMDLRNDLMKIVYPFAGKVTSKEEFYGSKAREHLQQSAKDSFTKLDGFLAQQGNRGPYFCGATPQSGDFALWEMLDQHQSIARDIGLSNDYLAENNFNNLRNMWVSLRGDAAMQGYFASEFYTVYFQNNGAYTFYSGQPDGATMGPSEELIAGGQQVAAGTFQAQTVQQGGVVQYGVGQVPMEPVATMIPGQAPPTIYAAQPQPATIHMQPQAATTIHAAQTQPATIHMQPQVVHTQQQLPATTIVGAPVYHTQQAVHEPTGPQITYGAPQVVQQGAPQPNIVLPHQGEIRTAPPVYIQAPAPAVTTVQAPPVPAYSAPPKVTPMLPPTTVVGEAVYAQHQPQQPQVPMEPVAQQPQVIAQPPTQSVVMQQQPQVVVQQQPQQPVYAAPPVPMPVLPHEGEIKTAPPVYVNIPQKPIQVEVPPPVTTGVAPPVYTYSAGPPTTAEPVYVTSQEVQQAPAPQVIMSGPVTTAEPVYMTAPAPVEPTHVAQQPVTYAAGPPQVAPPVYISGPPTTAEAVYVTAPAAEPAQFTTQVSSTQVAAPVYVQAPTTVTQTRVQGQAQQVYTAPPQVYGAGTVPMEPVATMVPGGGVQQQVQYQQPQTVQYIQQSQGGDLFQRLDQNGDGVISREEFTAAVMR